MDYRNILELSIFKAKFMILLLFWVGGWVGEIENKDQLSPTEVEIRTEFGKNKEDESCSTT